MFCTKLYQLQNKNICTKVFLLFKIFCTNIYFCLYRIQPNCYSAALMKPGRAKTKKKTKKVVAEKDDSKEASSSSSSSASVRPKKNLEHSFTKVVELATSDIDDAEDFDIVNPPVQAQDSPVIQAVTPVATRSHSTSSTSSTISSASSIKTPQNKPISSGIVNISCILSCINTFAQIIMLKYFCTNTFAQILLHKLIRCACRS